MLSNAYFLAKFRFDTAENEPAKYLQNSRKIQPSRSPAWAERYLYVSEELQDVTAKLKKETRRTEDLQKQQRDAKKRETRKDIKKKANQKTTAELNREIAESRVRQRMFKKTCKDLEEAKSEILKTLKVLG